MPTHGLSRCWYLFLLYIILSTTIVKYIITNHGQFTTKLEIMERNNLIEFTESSESVKILFLFVFEFDCILKDLFQYEYFP